MNNTICQSVCPNVHKLSYLSRATIGYLTVVIIPVTIVTNSIVLFGLVKTKSAGSRLFVIPLCINDLILGIVSQPLNTLYILHLNAADHCQFRYIIQFLSYGLFAMEFFLISVMGVERLIVLKYQMQEIRFRWEALRKYVLVFGILFSLASGTLSIMISLYSQQFYIFSFWALVTMVFFNVATASCYVIALQHVQVSVRKLYDRPSSDVIVKTKRKNLRHDMALARSVRLIIAVQMLATLPYFFTALVWSWQMADGSVKPLVEEVLVWSFVPFYLNSIVNVFLYSYHNRPLKKYIFEKVRSLFGKPVLTAASGSQIQGKKTTNDGSSSKMDQK